MKPSLWLPPLRQSTRTPSRLGRTIGVAAVTLAIAAVPASASAAVRTLSIQDPQGDASALGLVLDLESIAFHYDDVAGTLGVTWGYYTDVRSGIGENLQAKGSFGLERPIGPNVANDSVRGYWSLPSSGEATASLVLGAGVLPGTVTISSDGRVVTADFSHAMLAGHDWQYTWGGSSTNGDGFGTIFDKFWFDGFAPPNPVQPPVGPPMSGPTPPGGGGATSGDQGMTINGGALYTNDPDVTLSVNAPDWAKTLRVSNDGGFGAAKRFSVSNKLRWRLAESGSERLPKTVYLRFGNDAQTFTDDIILDQTEPTVSSATLASSSSPLTNAAVASSASSQARTYLVRLRAKDHTSGVAKLQFATNRRRPGALRRFERNSRYKGASAPKYVRVRDRAGNFSRWRSIR